MKTFFALIISLIFIRPCAAELLDPNFQLGFGPGKPWNVTPEGLSSIQSGLSTVDDLQGRYAKIDLGWTRPLGYHGSGATLSQRFFANANDTLRLWYQVQIPETSLPPDPFSLFANLAIRQQDSQGTYGPPVEVFKYTNPTTALNLGWTEYQFTFPANAAYLIQFNIQMGAPPEASDTDTFNASSALRFSNPVPEPCSMIALLATIAMLGIGFHRRIIGTTTRMSLSAMLGVLLIATSTQAQTVTFGSGPNQFVMEFVDIGSPGNAADTTGNPSPAGAVSYTYQMGKYEVSEDMIDKYNTAFGNSNGLTITKDTHGTNKPASSVSWNEAARFVNWLNTSTGGSPAYKFTTGGVNDDIALWTPADTLDYDAANPFRSLRANYVLPSANEWYKAAYFNPTTSIYSDYPNGLNTAPTAVASGTMPNTAVYGGQIGPADITQAGGLSPFGVMGLGGNVWEWEETEYNLVNTSTSSNRGLRGGYWINLSGFLSSYDRNFGNRTIEVSGIGFRVASVTPVPVPEPSTWAFIGTLTIGLFGWAVKAKRVPCGQASPSLG